MMTKKTDTKLAPFFIGGPVHAQVVPSNLREFLYIELHFAGEPEERIMYIRTLWYQPDGQSYHIFVREGIPIDDMTKLAHFLTKGV